MYGSNNEHEESALKQGDTGTKDCLPEPLEQLVAQVFRIYEARSPQELAALLRRRYRQDATFVDPTLAARPYCEVALQFYALQRLFTAVHISDISQPEVGLVAQPRGPSLVKVVVHSRQEYEFGRHNHISQQILPKSACLLTRTELLVDPSTGKVVRHEDSWLNKPAIRLPMAWRRLNSLCTHGIYRLLGWNKVMAEAEARCASRGDGDNQSVPGSPNDSGRSSDGRWHGEVAH